MYGFRDVVYLFPGLNSRKSWEQIYNIPKAIHSIQEKFYMLSLTRRIQKAAAQRRVNELYVQIPRELCERALTKLGHFARARTDDISPGPKPTQQRLAEEAHRVLYRLSLLWCLSQTTLDEITAENGFSLHPYLKTKTPGVFTEPNNTPSNPISRLTKYDTIMETTHTAAIPIKPKDLLEWTDNDKCQNYPTTTPIESLDSHTERIRTINEDIRMKAKLGLAESSKQAHLASKKLEELQTDEYPDLLNYAASPHGMERFMKTQIDNNLAQFLDKISPVQLVFYTTIEEIERDLIPSNLHPYYRKFAEIMEDKDFRTFAWTFPPIGLPPSSAWDNKETTPSPLKTPDGLPIPKMLALATAPCSEMEQPKYTNPRTSFTDTKSTQS